jgi:flagellar biogenesis protein FliO
MSSGPSLLCSSANGRSRMRLVDLLAGFNIRKTPRQLRLCESLSLGEKRLVAVIQYGGQRFLVGGGPQSVNLLARLGKVNKLADEATESRKE